MIPKTTSSHWFLLWFLFLAILAVGSYWLYSQWKERQLQALEIQIATEKNKPETESQQNVSPNVPQINLTSQKNHNEVMKLKQLLESNSVAQEALEEQNEALLAELNQLTETAETLEQIKRGREVANRFISQFLQYEPILEGQSFFSFFQSLALQYSETQSLSFKKLQITNPLLPQFRKEFVVFVVEMQESDIEAFAKFVGFHLLERGFHFPLTLVASRLIIDIEAIDFETPIFIDGQQTIPERDAHGELIVTQKAEMLEYSQTQQFFFRRGAKFSKAVLSFLKLYLEVG